MKTHFISIFCLIFTFGCSNKNPQWITTTDYRNKDLQTFLSIENKKLEDNLWSTETYEHVSSVMSKRTPAAYPSTEPRFSNDDNFFYRSKRNKKRQLVYEYIGFDELLNGGSDWKLAFNYSTMFTNKKTKLEEFKCSRSLSYCFVKYQIGNTDNSFVRSFPLGANTLDPNGINLPIATGVRVDWFNDKYIISNGILSEEFKSESHLPLQAILWSPTNTDAKLEVTYSADKSIYQMVIPRERYCVKCMVVPRKFINVSRYKTNTQLENSIVVDRQLHNLDVPSIGAYLYGGINDSLLFHLTNPMSMGENEFEIGDLVAIPFGKNKRLDDSKAKLVSRDRRELALNTVSFHGDVILMHYLVHGKRVYKTLNSSLEVKDMNWAKELHDTVIISAQSADSVNIIAKNYSYIGESISYLVNLKSEEISELGRSASLLKSPEDYEEIQKFAKSFDGEYIPYTVIRPKNATNIPAFMYVHGAHNMPTKPFRSSKYMKGWVEKGRALIIPNPRGDGTYGWKWNKATFNENKDITFKDVAAVAKSAISNQYTSPEMLGIFGGSAGGFVSFSTTLLYPELFKVSVALKPTFLLTQYKSRAHFRMYADEFGLSETKEQFDKVIKYVPITLAANIDLSKNTKFLIIASNTDHRAQVYNARVVANKLNQVGADYLYLEDNSSGHGWGSGEVRTKMVNSIFSFLELHLVL
jgi:prolyl oligopeptidase PreP (S9A serine peptidase family)